MHRATSESGWESESESGLGKIVRLKEFFEFLIVKPGITNGFIAFWYQPEHMPMFFVSLDLHIITSLFILYFLFLLLLF